MTPFVAPGRRHYAHECREGARARCQTFRAGWSRRCFAAGSLAVWTAGRQTKAKVLVAKLEGLYNEHLQLFLTKLTRFISLKMMIIMGVIGLVIVGIIASKFFVPKSLKHTLQLLLAHHFPLQSLHKRHTHTYQHSILYPTYQSKLILFTYNLKIPKKPLFRSDLTLISEHTTKFVYFLIPQRFFL